MVRDIYRFPNSMTKSIVNTLDERMQRNPPINSKVRGQSHFVEISNLWFQFKYSVWINGKYFNKKGG